MSCFTRHTPAASFAEPDPTKHVNYAFGMVLGVDDFTQEFAYLSGRDQWMARDLIGYGTARGLRVTVEVDAQGPRVVVAPGVAVSPRGQLICVESAQCAYINQWLAGHTRDLLDRLGSPPANSAKLYVVLCYRDCPTDDVPIPGEPCRSDSQLTTPSRLADDFELELSFRKPEQREEDALTDFVRWLKQVPVSASASTPFEQFLKAIRDAAGQWLAPDSPPSSPPSDFLFGSPPAFLNINPADLCRYTEAAFRLWVTELRPRWIGRWHGCAPAPFGLSHEHDEECVLLAELDVPLLQNLPSAEWVAGSGVVLGEEGRPYIVHLRMLQEWLLCAQQRGQAAGGGGGPLPPPPAIDLAGDVTGPPDNNVLRRISAVELDPVSPNAGQVLTCVNVAGQRRWRPANPAITSVVTTAGDVTGPSNNNVVGRLQRVPVEATVPTANQVLMAFEEGGAVRWRPSPLPPASPSDGPIRLDGDVTGASNANTVEALRATPLADARPANHQMLTAVLREDRIFWRPTHDFVRFTATRAAPTYGIAAAGVIAPGLTTLQPSYNDLKVTLQPGAAPQPGILNVTFTGYQQPVQNPADRTFSHHYIVKMTPLDNADFPSLTISVGAFDRSVFIVIVRNGGQPVAPGFLQKILGMQIEISRFPLAD
jgi:hypothetical protein